MGCSGYRGLVTSPFDDPGFMAALARMGVVHAPGMAASVMEDIAPLLAAEGFDVNGLDGNGDLGEFEAALARAMARVNLTLFTPVGAQRAGVLEVLRRVTISLANGDDEGASAVLAGVGSDPGEDEPGASHVIGVSLGLLDSWHTDPGVRAAVAATRVPRWNRAARAAATDVLALARKGRASASLSSLHRHGGEALFEGSALLVAASVIARARNEGTLVSDIAALMLGHGGASGPPTLAIPQPSGTVPGSSFQRARPALGPAGRPDSSAKRSRGGRGVAGRAVTEGAVWRGFAGWLDRAPSIAAPTVAEELRVLQALSEVALAEGVDLHRPADMETLIDLLWDSDDLENPGALQAVLETVDDYVHYRLDTGRDTVLWEDAHEAIQDALTEISDGSGLLEVLLEHAEEVGDAVRRDALAQVPIIGAVTELLDWIGAGRPVTQTGGVRRGDIEHVAGLLGVRAVGVAKRVGRDHDDDDDGAVVQALTMGEVPLLPQWWEALLAAELIRTTSTQVRPGPAAGEWAAGDLPPLEAAETVAAIFVAETLSRPIRHGPLGNFLVQESLLHLVPALTPGDVDLGVPESTLPGEGAVWMLRDLQRAGLVVLSDTGGVRIADGHRAALVQGLIALEYLTDKR